MSRNVDTCCTLRNELLKNRPKQIGGSSFLTDGNGPLGHRAHSEPRVGWSRSAAESSRARSRRRRSAKISGRTGSQQSSGRSAASTQPSKAVFCLRRLVYRQNCTDFSDWNERADIPRRAVNTFRRFIRERTLHSCFVSHFITPRTCAMLRTERCSRPLGIAIPAASCTRI